MAVWFNQPWVARQLGEGAMVLLHGKLRQRNQFWVTEHELIGNGEAPVHTLGLVPVHPATQGVSPARLRQLVSEARSRMLAVVEPLPARLRIEEQLAERPAAIEAVHFPISEEDERDARRRLAFEELFLLQLAVAGTPARPARGAARAAARGARRGGGPLAMVAPVRAHGRPAARDRGDRRRPRRASSRCSAC